MAEVATELTPEEEKQTIRDIAVAAEAQTKLGDIFCLINQRWWQEWLEYVNQNQTSNVNDGSSSEHHGSVSSSAVKRPSYIDNSDLIDEAVPEDSSMGTELLDTLVEGTDYILLPQEVWDQLYSWCSGKRWGRAAGATAGGGEEMGESGGRRRDGFFFQFHSASGGGRRRRRPAVVGRRRRKAGCGGGETEEEGWWWWRVGGGGGWWLGGRRRRGGRRVGWRFGVEEMR